MIRLWVHKSHWLGSTITVYITFENIERDYTTGKCQWLKRRRGCGMWLASCSFLLGFGVGFICDGSLVDSRGDIGGSGSGWVSVSSVTSLTLSSSKQPLAPGNSPAGTLWPKTTWSGHPLSIPGLRCSLKIVFSEAMRPTDTASCRRLCWLHASSQRSSSQLRDFLVQQGPETVNDEACHWQMWCHHVNYWKVPWWLDWQSLCRCLSGKSLEEQSRPRPVLPIGWQLHRQSSVSAETVHDTL